MRTLKALLLVAVLASVAACASLPDPLEHTFVLVRHAEKATDDPRDPSLSAPGMARSQRLATELRREKMVAVYASGYRRTQQTAAPTARDHGLAVQTYDATMEPVQFAALLRGQAPGVVLVVGHSNTMPKLAAALCNCTVGPIDDSQFGRRITIQLDPAGTASLDDRIDP